MTVGGSRKLTITKLIQLPEINQKKCQKAFLNMINCHYTTGLHVLKDQFIGSSTDYAQTSTTQLYMGWMDKQKNYRVECIESTLATMVTMLTAIRQSCTMAEQYTRSRSVGWCWKDAKGNSITQVDGLIEKVLLMIAFLLTFFAVVDGVCVVCMCVRVSVLPQSQDLFKIKRTSKVSRKRSGKKFYKKKKSWKKGKVVENYL